MTTSPDPAGTFDAWRQVAADRLDTIAGLPHPWSPATLANLVAIGRSGVGIGQLLRPPDPFAGPAAEHVARTLVNRAAPEPVTIDAAMGVVRDLLGPLHCPGPGWCSRGRNLIIAAHDLAAMAAEQYALSMIADTVAPNFAGDSPYV
jgi:hypothetical protein